MSTDAPITISSRWLKLAQRRGLAGRLLLISEGGLTAGRAVLGILSRLDFRSRALSMSHVSRHEAQNVLLVASVLLLGLYLRLSAVGSVPFHEDEYASALQTVGIIETGVPTLPSGFVHWQEPPALPYIMSVIWRVTGPDIAVGRLASVALGSISIILAYVLGRRLRNHLLGLVFAFLLATNLWSIASGTFFRSYALAEPSFLLISYFSVVWLQHLRSRGSYFLFLGVSSAIAIIGHYLLILMIPVVAALPLIANLSDAVVARVKVRSLDRSEASPWEGTRIDIRADTRIQLILLVVALGLGLTTWAVFQQGAIVARTIGSVTGLYFTVLPPNHQITLQSFVFDSLYGFYGAGMLTVIGLGGVVMLMQMQKSGLAVLLYLFVPLIALTTIFASLTVTILFDRFLFPFNPALLLMAAFLVVWIGENIAPTSSSNLDARHQTARHPAHLVVVAILAVGLVTLSSSFSLAFDHERTPEALTRWFRSKGEPRTPSFQLATAHIAEHTAPGDVVLSTRAYAARVELPDLRGYWLTDNPNVVGLGAVDSDGGLVHRISGYPVVTGLRQLVDLVAQEQGGWLIVPYYHQGPGTLSNGIWSFVNAQMSEVSEGSDDTIKLYRWERGVLDFSTVVQPPTPFGNAGSVEHLADDVSRVSAHPGDVDWAGLDYHFDSLIEFDKVAIDLRVILDKLSNGESVTMRMYGTEEDGDRWRTPDLRVDATDDWQEYFFAFSDLDFWALGDKTKQPNQVVSIRVVFVGVKDLSFDARVKIQLFEQK